MASILFGRDQVATLSQKTSLRLVRRPSFMEEDPTLDSLHLVVKAEDVYNGSTGDALVS